MLVLTRKLNESLIIGDNIEITVLELSNGSVRIGINAPKKIRVYRKEIIDQITQENKEARVDASKIDLFELTRKFSK